MKASDILVIIVTYNGLKWLERCVSSALVGADVLVVDNGSTDGTVEYLRMKFPEVEIMESPDNLGFAAANNKGFDYALEKGYDFIYLLNQDAWLLDGALSVLKEAMRSETEYAVLSPLQLSASGCFDPLFEKNILRKVRRDFGTECIPAGVARNVARSEGGVHCTEGGTPSAEGGVSIVKVGVPSVDGGSIVKDGCPVGGAQRVITVQRVMAAHWLVRVNALKEIGKFAENIFPHYGEDDNFCDRARFKGWKIGIVPAASAVHDREYRKTPKAELIRRNYFVNSLCRLCNPNHPLWIEWIYILAFTAVKTVKYFSLQPIGYFFKLFTRTADIRKTRRM